MPCWLPQAWGLFVYATTMLREEGRKRREMAGRAHAVINAVRLGAGGRPGLLGWFENFGQRAATWFGELVKPREAKELSKTTVLPGPGRLPAAERG
ncbi:hypothetical protein, partial [Desulfosporosinus metallidurans]|uniref:hypothetical protein n=1 Tax=Desulfosporosinus metallidurans TaxID=1888891 RepID=UPI001F308F1E